MLTLITALSLLPFLLTFCLLTPFTNAYNYTLTSPTTIQLSTKLQFPVVYTYANKTLTIAKQIANLTFEAKQPFEMVYYMNKSAVQERNPRVPFVKIMHANEKNNERFKKWIKGMHTLKYIPRADQVMKWAVKRLQLEDMYNETKAFNFKPVDVKLTIEVKNMTVDNVQNGNNTSSPIVKSESTEASITVTAKVKVNTTTGVQNDTMKSVIGDNKPNTLPNDVQMCEHFGIPFEAVQRQFAKLHNDPKRYTGEDYWERKGKDNIAFDVLTTEVQHYIMDHSQWTFNYYDELETYVLDADWNEWRSKFGLSIVLEHSPLWRMLRSMFW